MSTTTELAKASKEYEVKRPQSVAGHSLQEPVNEQDGGVLGRVFSGAPGEPPADSASRFLHSPTLSHPVNNSMRAVALQRAQRNHGNHFVQRLLPGIQRQPANSYVQRCAGGKICEECQAAADLDLTTEPPLPSSPFPFIQTRAETTSDGAGAKHPQKIIPAGSIGEPLHEGTRGFMESRFGEDFSEVRVHTDAQAGESARGLNADAYTSGRDIYFAPGMYAPASPAGQRLLAHELAHTIQQDRGIATQEIATKSHAEIVVGEADHPLEHEADRAAAAALNATPHSAVSLSADRSCKIRRGVFGTIWEYTGGEVVSAAEWAGGEAWEGAKAVGRGAEWLGEEAWAGAKAVGRGFKKAGQWAWAGGKWLYGKGKQYLSAAWECAKKTGSFIGSSLFSSIDISSYVNPPAPDVSSASELVGKPAPTEDNPDTLNTIMEVLNHPCLKMVPVLSEVTSLMSGTTKFLAGAYELWKHPEKIWDALKAAVGGWIAKIPEATKSIIDQAVSASAALKVHLEGIWRRLGPKLEYLAANWWQVLKDTGRELLWPWPGVWEDLKKTWAEIKSGASELWDLNFSKAADHLLAAVQQVNGILGLLWGWFAIFSILIGAILGAIFGFGGGAIPGAMAGAAFAFEVGEALLLATLATETAVIAKAIHDLTSTKQTQDEIEEDYEKIAGSGLTLGITGAMFLLGAIAARFAKGLLGRVASLFRKPPEIEAPKIEVPKVEAPKVETPKVEGPKAEPAKVEPTNAEPPKAEPPKTAAEAARAEDLAKIQEKAADPDNIQRVTDPDFAGDYDAEIEVDGHTYRRSRSDGTWCRFGSKICKIKLSEVKGAVDDALAKKPEISPAEKAKMKAEAEAERKQNIKEAKKLIGKNKKFKDADLEADYQRYVERKKAQGLRYRNRADWKVTRDFFWGEESPFTRGRNFNKTAGENYPYNEVNLENGKRLDSYRRSLKDPSEGEIVSRKAVDFDAIDEATFKRYLQEFKDKYAKGTKIRSDKYPRIDGEKLRGKYILEVPATNEGTPEAKVFEKIAKSEGVEIRYRPE
jgi:hypothetical protein